MGSLGQGAGILTDDTASITEVSPFGSASAIDAAASGVGGRCVPACLSALRSILNLANRDKRRGGIGQRRIIERYGRRIDLSDDCSVWVGLDRIEVERPSAPHS